VERWKNPLNCRRDPVFSTLYEVPHPRKPCQQPASAPNCRGLHSLLVWFDISEE